MAETRPAPAPAADPTDQRRRQRQQRTQMILRVLGIPGGVGIVATIQFLRSGQWGLALLTGLASIGVTVLAIFAKFFADLTNKVLDRIEERLEESTDSLAEWIVAQLESALVRFWWKVTPQFKGAYYQSLIYGYRTYRTQGLKTPGEFSPDLAKVFVPLRITSKSLEQISPALIQRQETAKGLEIWDFLAESQREPAYQRIVIIGAPGSGKTTLLKHITLTYAYNTHRRRSRQVPTLVPVLLPLHKIRDDITAASPKDLPTVIVEQVKTLPKGKTLNLSPQWFESKLLSGDCLVMLDGLDEVADETQRRQVSQWVDGQMRAYPEARWILTSRPYGYRNAQLEEARTTLGVQAFNLKQMELFLRRWYLQNEILRQARKPDPGVEAAAVDKADDLIGRIKNYPPLAAMALNPLLLTMIATVHDNRGALPGSRVDLYDEICDVLLVRRQEAKGLTEPFPLKAEQKKSVLQVLALELMEREDREFSLEQAVAMIAAPLRNVAGDTVTPTAFLAHIETVSGLLLEREAGLYQFAHLSFQEYLASAQVKEADQVRLLVENIQLTWWHETIRLFAAKNDTTALVNAALDKPTRDSLSIAYDCAEEGKSLSPQARARLEEFSLESADAEIAELAARVKLTRRLNQLLRLDDGTQIDRGLISRAEYQLFLIERGMWFGEDKTRKPWYTPEDPLRPETHISLDDALEFCRWLQYFDTDERYVSDFFEEISESDRKEFAKYAVKIDPDPTEDPIEHYYFRLPTDDELQRTRTPEELSSEGWTLGGKGELLRSIRVVKAHVASEFHELQELLEFKDWQAADAETRSLLARAKKHQEQQQTGLDNPLKDNTPCHCLAQVESLWVHYSGGRYGFGVQAGIWEATLGSGHGKRRRFGMAVGWETTPQTKRIEPSWFPGHYPQRESDWESEVLLRRFMDCGIERVIPLAAFEVVTVNAKGEEIQQEWHQARFFVEDLGKGIPLEMMAIPGGQFVMGTPEEEGRDDEGPPHEVTVSPFFMGKYAVTQVQWRQVAALPRVNRRLSANPSKFKGNDQQPVEQVSWEEAVEFCQRLSAYTNRTYRLPTEAEWEYACRAGTTTPFHFGETITTSLANYRGQDWKIGDTTYPGNYGEGPYGEFREKTTPVGMFPANRFGLCDMHGNVWEWCQDVWHGNYDSAPTDGTAWMEGSSQDRRVCRGGSWNYDPRDCRSAVRNHNAPGDRNNNLGFRVVCVAAP
ncbi:SUMF1/EgtB/PvdO family nonheme iron enzyme [Halomicronema sp. CCY15110]|uniref:SUMF1/EgtB/PvdO family nonheme iron enzyme n=1 Tax=Halomicronema sp. CCY15110 TaxID=2767773 RepID=UPI00194FF101|nr:SUMF1/EgtB/PvdO family nonheme iron enzyme [Halomicronema sp. CCY15110]